MATSEKHIVIPYRRARAGMVPGEMRQASNPESARRIANAMSDRFEGVAAYSVFVDSETGDMTSPSLIASHGTIPELSTD